MPSWLTRRRFVGAGLVGTAAGLGAFAYGKWIERHAVELVRQPLALNLGADGPALLKVVLMSDLHYDPLCEGEYMTQCVQMANQALPDVVVLLGDFVSDEADVMPELGGILAGLKAPLGVHAVLGNHDFWGRRQRPVQKALAAAGIHDLMNRVTPLEMPGGKAVRLAGLESAWGGKPDIASIAGPKEEPVLLAHHEPDPIDKLPAEIRQRVAIQVSGHTHGGQICAPGGIVLRRPSYGQVYSRGLYELGDTRVYVNRGLGTMAIHLRSFCRPEITLLEITNTALTIP